MGSDHSNFIRWYAIIPSTTWIIIIIIIIIINLLISSSFSFPIINNITPINYYTNHNNNNNNHTQLDDYLFNYSSSSLAQKPDHTGILYNISLPSNFSDMKVSILRLKSSTLWAKEANLNSFDIPPKIITMPHVKRLAFIYENLGNFSSHYYDLLPDYTFLTKVIGFAVYNASGNSGGKSGSNQRLNITLYGEPIKVEFSQNSNIIINNVTTNNVDNRVKKCVRFDPLNGVVELANMLRPNVCLSKGVGHFVIAMPKINDTIKMSSSSSSSSPSASVSKPPSSLGGRRRERKGNEIALWVWWVVGFAGGFVGLGLLVLCFVIGYKIFVSRKIKRLEKNSLESESLDTLWIGNSKLPLAPVSRTQAVLENDLAP